MNYRIVDRAPMTIMGIALRTDNTQAEHTIPRFWDQFYSENVFEKIPNKCSSDILGLYVDYESDASQSYTLVIGCHVGNVDSIPDGMIIKEIPAASYAVYTAKGEFPTSLNQTWRTIWESDLPRSYSGDFEVYGKRFENGEIDVYISLNVAAMAK